MTSVTRRTFVSSHAVGVASVVVGCRSDTFAENSHRLNQDRPGELKARVGGSHSTTGASAPSVTRPSGLSVWSLNTVPNQPSPLSLYIGSSRLTRRGLL
jgi:hypothetical protein